MDNGNTSHADPILLDGRSNSTDPGTIPGAEVNTFVRRTQTQIRTAQAPAEAQLVTLLFQCWNLPNVAKQELEAFLREWCVKHSIAGPIGDHNQEQRQQQQERQQQQQLGRRRVHQGLQHEEQRRDDTWSRPLLPAAADLQDDGRMAGRCKPPNPERLWSGSLNIAWALYPKIPSVGQVRCSVRRRWSSHDAAVSWRWRDRLVAHDVPVPLKMQGRPAAGSDDSGPVQDGVRPWQSAAGVEIYEGDDGDAVEENPSPGDSGGGASMEERASTPACGMISGVGPDLTGGGSGHVSESGGGASIGCALGDGDKARSGDAGNSVTLNSDTTMRRSLLNLEDAIAFNLAYKEENNTPPYNRLPVLPLRLGSGLAASALPCAALTHGSALWQALGVRSTAEVNYGSRLGPADGKVNLRPLKRQRIDNNGGNTLNQDFAFVLDSCWNCGSYGHELQDCVHPRKYPVIDACRRESSLVAQRTARQAVAVQRRGPRKASYRRYFSTSTAEEEQEAAEATAAASLGVGTVAECYDKGGGQKRDPPGIRPGILSAALALALNMSCPLDPPPWLIGMAVHGLPPAYCRGPYIPGVSEPLATDPQSVESGATVAWEGTCSQALCGALVAAGKGYSSDGTEGGEVAVQAVELLDYNPDRAAGDGVEGLPPKTTDVGCPKESAFPDTQNTSAPIKWVADQPDIIAAVKGSSWGRTGRYNVDESSGRLVSGSIAALSDFSPDSEGSEGTRSSSVFAVGQQASADLRTAAATVAGTAAVASEHGFGGSEGACEEIGPAMEETALERRCGRSDSGARGTESVISPDDMEPATLLQHGAVNTALTIAEQPACAVAIDAAVGVQGVEQESDMDIDMDTDEDTVSLDAAAAGGVAAGSTGSEPDADADTETALLLQPLLPAAPRHVLFAGLNASIPQGACREHWQRALISARQVIACVTVVRGWGRRHEGPQLAPTWAAKVTGGGQGPSGAAADAAQEQVEAVEVVSQAKARDVPQEQEQPQQQTWQQESFPQVRQRQPHWQSSMPTQDKLQQQAWWHQHKPQLAGNNFMQQHIIMLKQQQQHPGLATAFPVFLGGPTFQGFY